MKKNLVSVFSLSFMVAFVNVNAQISKDSIKERAIEEVVLINVGYGKQKKSVVTGAISQVTAKDLEKVPNGGVGTMLQGRTSGVTIAANSGAPGSGATIRVRGVTTFGGANDPLWVVDGIPMENADIATINQADIESMEILKDAASAAIYGTRAAKGVILITTKRGRKGRISVGYNGYLSVSSTSKVLNLLNATEYATLMNERSVAGGGNVLYSDLSSLGKGTDWQKLVFSNNAMGTNHEVSVSGSGEKSDFYLSFNIQGQEGIVAKQISNYEKKSFRINSNHHIFDKIKVGQSLFYTHQKNVGIGNSNNEFGGVLASAINLDPITLEVISDPIVANAAPYTNQYVVRDPNGNPYGISNIVGQEIVNPLALIRTQLGGYGWSDVIIGNVYAEAEILKGLKFKTSLGGKKAFWGGQSFKPLYQLNDTNVNLGNNVLSKSLGEGFDWNVENTLNYDAKIKDHEFNILVGQGSYEAGQGSINYINHSGLPTNDYTQASFNTDINAASKTGSTSTFIPIHRTSLFSRLNYNFQEKYLVTGIIRRDGSSLFGPNNKYGIFSSASAGWVISKENFWKDNNIVNTLKLRAGYGVNGNDGALSTNQYESLIAGAYNYYTGGTIQIGSAPATVANPDLKWETTTQTNIGIDAKILRNFNLTVEYYKKQTNGILRQVTIPGYVGVANSPFANVADMSNQGLEVELGYNKKFKELRFSANANFSTLKNEITGLGDQLFFEDGSFQSLQNSITRSQVGQAYGSFYGYKTAGIFQNWAEVNSYTNSGGTLIQPNAQPGDFKWTDTNGDGKISDDDRTYLGSSLPKINFGLNLNLEYKNFDLSALVQGAMGNKIFQGLRRLDIGTANYQTIALTRWTGEGTSNEFPRLTSDDTNGNFTKMSDFYLEKGDYARLKLVSLGYTVPKLVSESIKADKIRLYVSGSNLLTLTKYTGYDPEIGGTILGIDKGYYPQARTFLFGVNVQF